MPTIQMEADGENPFLFAALNPFTRMNYELPTDASWVSGWLSISTPQMNLTSK